MVSVLHCDRGITSVLVRLRIRKTDTMAPTSPKRLWTHLGSRTHACRQSTATTSHCWKHSARSWRKVGSKMNLIDTIISRALDIHSKNISRRAGMYTQRRIRTHWRLRRRLCHCASTCLASHCRNFADVAIPYYTCHM